MSGLDLPQNPHFVFCGFCDISDNTCLDECPESINNINEIWPEKNEIWPEKNVIYFIECYVRV